MKNVRGFTLIELLVTLAVAGVLLTIAVPNFRSTIQDSRLITQANTLVGMFGLARSQAVSLGGNSVVSVCPGTVNNGTVSCGSDWTAGWVVFSSTYTATAPCTSGTKTAIRSYPALPDGTSLKFAGSSTITFLPSGLLCTGTTTGNFVFCDSRGVSDARAVNLSSTGNAKSATTTGEDITGAALSTC